MLIQIQEPTPRKNNLDERDIAVGIDLGTTNSLVAFSESQIPRVLSAGDAYMLPSIVSYLSNGNVVAGQETSNSQILKSIKRLMGKSSKEILESESIPQNIKKRLLEKNDEIKLELGDIVVSPIEVSAEILKKLKLIAEEALKQEVTQAVITVPAYFDDPARSATRKAAELAGLKTLRLISEPTAAAFAYGLDKNSEGIFLVYDLGGGTFDISLLEMQKGVFRVLGVNGDNMLGGDDVDLLVARYFFEQVQKIIPSINFEELEQTLLYHGKEAKHMLTAQDLFTQAIKVDGIAINLHINISDFNKIIEPLVKKTIKLINTTLNKALLDEAAIQGLILVGGSTKMRLIREALSQNFTFKIYNDIDPEKVVAMGAALQAENIAVENKNLIIDVVPLSLGMEVMGGLVERVIERNTPIPVSIEQEFTTYVDNQTAIKFNILQGDRERASDCRLLGSFELKDIPPARAGVPKIIVKFSIDADGLLCVTAESKDMNVKNEFIFDPAYGMDASKFQEMLKDAFEHAEEDHHQKLFIKTKLEAEKLCNALTKKLAQEIGAHEVALIKDTISKVEDAIRLGNQELLDKELEVLKQVAEPFLLKAINNDINQLLKGQKII